MSKKNTLSKMLGPRGGYRNAVNAIRARGGVVNESYIAACSRSSASKIRARIHRKYGFFPANPDILAYLASTLCYDRLATPAHILFSRSDMEHAHFPSPYGTWATDYRCGGLIVPFGAYYEAINPGHGKSPRIIWKLRSGGIISEWGHISPKPLPLP